MRALLLLPLLVTFVLSVSDQDGAGAGGGSPLAVLGSKWSKSRQTVEYPNAGSVAPAPAMTAANRNFERNRRINDPAAVRAPNADTLDARSAAMEKNVQESRSPKTKTVDGFEYRGKVKYASTKDVEVLFCEYQVA